MQFQYSKDGGMTWELSSPDGVVTLVGNERSFIVHDVPASQQSPAPTPNVDRLDRISEEIEKRRQQPSPARLIPDAECAQGKCACTTSGCWGVCSLKRNSTASETVLVVSQPSTVPTFEMSADQTRAALRAMPLVQGEQSSPATGRIEKLARNVVATYDDPHLSPVAVERAIGMLRKELGEASPARIDKERDECSECGGWSNKSAELHNAGCSKTAERAPRGESYFDEQQVMDCWRLAAGDWRKFANDIERRALHAARRSTAGTTAAPSAADALRSIRDLARFDTSPSAAAYYRKAENALAAIECRDAVELERATAGNAAPTEDDGGCWTDEVPCDKCAQIGWHKCGGNGAERNAGEATETRMDTASSVLIDCAAGNAAPDEGACAAALRKIIEMNRQHAEDQYGDANKAESWACIVVARKALAETAAPGDLPPLPPETLLAGNVDIGDDITGHTDDDMREYGIACIASNAATAEPGDLTNEEIDAITARVHPDGRCTAGSLRKLVREVLASNAGAAPGWQTVPKILTREMSAAGKNAWACTFGIDMDAIYTAILAAAPSTSPVGAKDQP
jgi:hypothetical protein